MKENTIIFLCGPTGIGKSTISNELEKKGFFRIDVDTIIKSALARFDDELLKKMYGVLMEKNLAPGYGDFAFFKLRFENAFQKNGREPAAALYSMIHPHTELHVDIIENELDELYKAALSPAYSRYLIEHMDEYCAGHENIVMDFGSRKGIIVTPEFCEEFGIGFDNKEILCMLPSDRAPTKIIQNILGDPSKRDTEETNVHPFVKRASLIKYLENKVKEINDGISELLISDKKFDRIKRLLLAVSREEKTELIAAEPKILKAVSMMIAPSIQCRINTLAAHFEEIHGAKILPVDIDDTPETIVRKLDLILDTTPQLSSVPPLESTEDYFEEPFVVPPSTVPSGMEIGIFRTRTLSAPVVFNSQINTKIETGTPITASVLRQSERPVIKQLMQSRRMIELSTGDHKARRSFSVTT